MVPFAQGCRCGFVLSLVRQQQSGGSWHATLRAQRTLVSKLATPFSFSKLVRGRHWPLKQGLPLQRPVRASAAAQSQRRAHFIVWTWLMLLSSFFFLAGWLTSWAGAGLRGCLTFWAWDDVPVLRVALRAAVNETSRRKEIEPFFLFKDSCQIRVVERKSKVNQHR